MGATTHPLVGRRLTPSQQMTRISSRNLFVPRSWILLPPCPPILLNLFGFIPVWGPGSRKDACAERSTITQVQWVDEELERTEATPSLPNRPQQSVECTDDDLPPPRVPGLGLVGCPGAPGGLGAFQGALPLCPSGRVGGGGWRAGSPTTHGMH